ncbi:sialic acid-binding Ig-like lectin 10 [Ranitomeya imitator]|uniref:sialic acid-binding Ig-like lectin 10 n=1 Tax=Ranitomeya imitator TaxID=111125 RepID=UPI0037E8D9B4
MFFTGKISDRDCSLLINDVLKSDQNIYFFRFEGKKQFSYKTNMSSLTVTDLTDKPEISVGTLEAGKEANVTCKSPGVCAGTAPSFTWTGQHGESSNYNDSYPNRTSIHFSNFTFTPARSDNGKSLGCKVAFQSSKAVTQETITLNVEYPPNVTITTKGGELMYKINLKEDLSPNFVFVHTQNFVNDHLINQCWTGLLDNQILKMNSFLYETTGLIVDQMTFFKGGVSNNTFIAKEGDSAQINCTVDSNPIAEITWLVENEKKEAITGQWLIYNLTNISPSDAGKYLCKGKNNLGSFKKNIDIVVHYAPRTPNIKCVTTEDCRIGEEHMIFIMEDSTLTLACTTKSLPEASLTWIPPCSNNTKYSVAQGHLSFNKVSLSDEGQFTCVASNIYGMSNSSIIIKVTPQPRSDTGTITAVSCVVVIVFLLIGGVLVVHFFRK